MLTHDHEFIEIITEIHIKLGFRQKGESYPLLNTHIPSNFDSWIKLGGFGLEDEEPYFLVW